MNYALELFIDYCDDMEIANEAVDFKRIGKSIWIGIQNLIDKIIQFFKNLLYNVNYFKNAKLPMQQHEDIQLLVQNLTPRYELINNISVKLFRALSFMKKNNKMLKPEMQDQIDMDYSGLSKMVSQAHDDILVINRDVQESPEYKRIKNNEYDYSDLSIIPLSRVVGPMKQSQNYLVKYKGSLRKVENLNPINTTGMKVINDLKEMYSGLLESYKMQIELINIYFANAKASLGAVVKNIKEVKEKSVQLDRDYNRTKSLSHMAMKSMKYNKIVKLTPEKLKRFLELDKIIIDTNNELSRYPEYKKARDELCALFGVPTHCVLLYLMPKKDSLKVKIAFINEMNKPFKLLSTNQLYHTSPIPNLNELIGTYFGIERGSRRLWEDPRIYFAIGNPMSKDGSKFNGIDPFSDEKRSALYKYIPIDKVDSVWLDREMGSAGAAVFIKSTSIRVRQCD